MFRLATIVVATYGVLCCGVVGRKIARGGRAADEPIGKKQAPKPSTDRRRERLLWDLVRAERERGVIAPSVPVRRPLNNQPGPCSPSDYANPNSCLYHGSVYGLSNTYTWECTTGNSEWCVSCITVVLYVNDVEYALYYSNEYISCGCVDGTGPCSGSLSIGDLESFPSGDVQAYVKVYNAPWADVTPGATPAVLAWQFDFTIGDDGIPIGTFCGGCPSPCK